MARNLVFFFDGTGKEPRLGRSSNVYRMMSMAPHDGEQVLFYDAGVGTLGSPKSTTALGSKLTRIAGLAFGYGLKDNVVAAYRFLAERYEPGDRVFLFGFSRGAYSARAFAGLLYQIGLVRPEHVNMIPYALKHYWWHVDGKPKTEEWELADEFSGQFCRADFPRRQDRSIHHIGLWDTVNATGVLRGRLELPWTAKMPMAASLRHAVSLDEQRRPFDPQLVATDAPGFADGTFREVWFSGVHSDVGGTFMPDHQLAEITLAWIAEGAVNAGLRLDPEAIENLTTQPDQLAQGEIHNMGPKWWLVSVGHHRTVQPDTAQIHQSVLMRPDASKRRLPAEHTVEPWDTRSTRVRDALDIDLRTAPADPTTTEPTTAEPTAD